MLTRKIRFVILSLLLLLVFLFFYRQFKPDVIFSGKIIYDEFKKGSIEIYWTTNLQHGTPRQKGLTYLSAPGSYSLRIPKNYNNIYICARNRGSLHESFAYFISDPIKVGKTDRLNYDIILKTNKPLMDDYRGKTIRLSGKISFVQYKNGKMVICIYSPEYLKKIRLPPDIARTSLDKPGSFSVKVPIGIGKVCVVAVNIPEGASSGNSPLCPRADYISNPVIVEDKDISGIDIVIN
jgi:hypothetical protein